jgi:hypothetical protein
MEEFMQDAQYQLSDNEYNKLEALDIKKLNEAQDFGNLKNAIVLFDELETDRLEIRSAKRQSRTPNIVTMPSRIIGKNPLEVEQYLMKALWDELDAIDTMEQFTITEVFIYKLKLQILCRLDSFNTEKGLEILDKVVYPAQENMEV